MEQIFFEKLIVALLIKKLSIVYRIWRVSIAAHNSPTLHHTLSQVNPVYLHIYWLFKICFNIILAFICVFQVLSSLSNTKPNRLCLLCFSVYVCRQKMGRQRLMNLASWGLYIALMMYAVKPLKRRLTSTTLKSERTLKTAIFDSEHKCDF